MLIKIVPLLLIVLLCSCSKRQMTNMDVSIAASQSATSVACYQNLPKEPDMSNWSVDKITAYQSVKALADANKIIAKVSLDPCAGAAGKNVYDAEIAFAHENTEQSKNLLNFGESLATKGLYAYLAYEVFGFFENSGSTNLNLNGSGNNLDGVGNKGNAWSQIKNPWTDNSMDVFTP